nr:hypothetical protein [Angustibacter aerolatus]
MNDTLGHRVGDTMLVEIAHRLAGTLENRARRLLAHGGAARRRRVRHPAALGGDRRDRHRHRRLAAERACVVRCWSARAAPPSCAPAASASRSPPAAPTRPASLFGEADLAMYQAKDAGRDGLALFDHQPAHRGRGQAAVGAAAAHGDGGRPAARRLPAHRVGRRRAAGRRRGAGAADRRRRRDRAARRLHRRRRGHRPHRRHRPVDAAAGRGPGCSGGRGTACA